MANYEVHPNIAVGAPATLNKPKHYDEEDPPFHHAGFDLQSALAPSEMVSTAPPGLASYHLFQHYVDAPSTVGPKSPFTTSSEDSDDGTIDSVAFAAGNATLGASGTTGGELGVQGAVKKPVAPWLSLGGNGSISGTPGEDDPPALTAGVTLEGNL